MSIPKKKKPIQELCVERDTIVMDQLDDTGKFNWMKSIVEKEEHSLEMHLPFIYKIFEE